MMLADLTRYSHPILEIWTIFRNQLKKLLPFPPLNYVLFKIYISYSVFDFHMIKSFYLSYMN